jgi:hypothetical protein
MAQPTRETEKGSKKEIKVQGTRYHGRKEKKQDE